MPLNPESFLYERDSTSRVATLTLNRPERLNALTFQVYRELAATFRALDSEAGVRAILLTGKGKAFCSGGDVNEIIGALLDQPFEELLEFTRLTCDLVHAIRTCRRPVVAALNGTVAGAGAVIAAAADLRVASESARIAFLFTRVGLSGADMGASWLLPRIVGHGRATELLMTGDFVSPEAALQMGLYNRVVPDEELMDTAVEMARKLARRPSRGLAVTKEALNREASMDLDTALSWEAQVQAGLMLDPNFRKAHQAFQEKREPEFE